MRIKYPLFILMFFLFCCKAHIQPLSPPPKELLSSPEGVLEYFKKAIENPKFYRYAYHTFSTESKKVIAEEEFVMVLNKYPLLLRLLKRLQIHDRKVHKKSGYLLVCNNEFGISAPINIKLETFTGNDIEISAWSMRIAKEHIDMLIKKVIEWWKLQRKVAGGYLYVYPPDWKFTPIWEKCPCKQKAD